MDIDHFYAWLSLSLRARRTGILTGCHNRLPTAGELDTLQLLKALQDDVVNVSEHLWLLFQMMMLIEGVSMLFEHKSYALFQRIGVGFMPRNASDLVRWLMNEILHGEPRQYVYATRSRHNTTKENGRHEAPVMPDARNHQGWPTNPASRAQEKIANLVGYRHPAEGSCRW